MIPLDEALRPKWLFGATVHEGCDRAGYYEQGDFATEYGSPKCIVKLGCWGPVVKCNVPKRGWINGIGGCPNVGGICIGCTMPGFPDKFMPFMDEPPGGKLSSTASGLYGAVIRNLRGITARTVDKEPRWRHNGNQTHHRSHAAPGRSTLPGRGASVSASHNSHWAESSIRDDNHHSRADNVQAGARPARRDGVGSRSPGSWAASASTPRSISRTRKSSECHSTSSIFRGYSIFMKGKDPRDAHFITSRICGICGDNHATCSCYTQNMAYGVKPPHLGEWIVNLGEAAEYMFDHNIFQENLVGVDFCEKMVAETNPSVLAQAENTAAPHADAHGYRTIADIMRSLNPFSGEFYREALRSAGGRERCSASWKVATCTRPRCTPAGSAPSRPSS